MSSETYRDVVSSWLYIELTEEQECEIIGSPFVVNDRYDLCLIPVRDDLGRTLFAFCEQKELHELLSIEDIERIKEFDLAPYGQEGNDEH